MVHTAAIMPSRTSILKVEGLEVEVTRKSMRSIRIVVEPPDGRVRVSAPHRVGDDAVLAMLHERREWIERHRERMARAPRRVPLQYVDGERLPWLGRELELRVRPDADRTRARLDTASLVIRLSVRAGAGRPERAAAVEAACRRSLAAVLPYLARPWEDRLGVRASRWGVRRMTSRWGSCNTKSGAISLNLELARRSPSCLEYVIVHELAHLVEPGHGPRFKAILDAAIPDWKARERLLASEPIAREP